MHSARWTALVALVAALGTGSAGADEIHLKGGGVLTGRVLSRGPTTVEVEVGVGRVTVPAATVARIEKGRTILDDYDERVAVLGTRDRLGWLEVARWASSHGLAARARSAYERVLSFAPRDPEANRALGKVELDGRWVTPEESYRARGYVPFEGTWVTPDERARILRDREEREQLVQVLAATDARVREAEARARHAEMRAAEAEAAVRTETVEGIPLWWVWGPGPMVWPSGPVVGSRCREIWD